MLKPRFDYRLILMLLIGALLFYLFGCNGGGGGGKILPPSVSIRGLSGLQYDSIIPVEIDIVTKAAVNIALSVEYQDGLTSPFQKATSLPGHVDPTSIPWIYVPAGGTRIIFWWHAVADLPPGGLHENVSFRATAMMKDGVLAQFVKGPFTVDHSAGTLGAVPPYVPGGALPPTSCGMYYDTVLPHTGGQAPVIWSRYPPGTQLPYFLELTYDGHVKGTIPENYGPVTISFTALATDSNNFRRRSSAGTFTIFIDCAPVHECAAPPEILFSSMPNAKAGEAYFFQSTAAAGHGALSWSVISGQLPDGFNITNTGLISGTPSEDDVGIYNFTLQVCDSCPNGVQCDTVPVTFTIKSSGQGGCDDGPTIITQNVLSGREGNAYSSQLEAVDGHGTLSWEIASGALPNGLGLSSTGLISGTPAPGTGGQQYNFTVQVCDSCPEGAQCDDAGFTMSVVPAGNPCAAAPVITTGSPLPNGTLDVPYDVTFVATGGEGNLTWKINNPTEIPSGLVWSTTGKLSGTPVEGSVGVYVLNITVEDSCPEVQKDTKDFGLRIFEPCSAGPSITTPGLPDGAEGATYNFLLNATGGDGALTWTIISGPALPAGLVLVPETGRIQGVPEAGTAGEYNGIEIQVADSCHVAPQKDSSIFNLKITSGGPCAAPPDITTTSLPNGTVGSEYNVQLAAVNGEGALDWKVVTDNDPLPNGLALETDGLLHGTPASGTNGTYNIHFQVCDACPTPQCDDAILQLVIKPLVTKSITVVSPNGGETWGPGTSHEITWTSQNLFGNVLIEYSKDGFAGEIILISPSEANDGTYMWDPIPDDPSDTVLVRISSINDPLVNDLSDAYFTIGEEGCAPAPEIQLSPSFTIPAGAVLDYPLTAIYGEGMLTWALQDSDPLLPPTIHFLTMGHLRGATDVTDAGSYSLDIQVCDSCADPGTQCDHIDDWQLTLESASGCTNPPPVIQDATIPTPVADGSPYTHTMSVTGGDTPLFWYALGLPSSLSINFQTGEIHGNVQPSEIGDYTVYVGVCDACSAVPQCDSMEYHWTITSGCAPPPQITTTNLPVGQVNAPYNAQLEAIDGEGTLSWSLMMDSDMLPPNLTLTFNGNIVGIPAEGTHGTYNLHVQVCDSCNPQQCDDAYIVLMILPE